MKYGQTLQQRSISEWANCKSPFWSYHPIPCLPQSILDNVDYNEIKNLIKVRTTKGHAQAIAIPGKDHEASDLHKFQGELYVILQEQHQRVDLFVQCKAGEITRRLGAYSERGSWHLALTMRTNRSAFGQANRSAREEKLSVQSNKNSRETAREVFKS